MDKTEAHRAEIMARVHSQGQLICWDDEEEGEEEVSRREGGEVVERARTDSSESFVCINEEGLLDTVNGNANKEDNKEVEQIIDEKVEFVNKGGGEKEKDGHGSDDDWEKWNDD